MRAKDFGVELSMTLRNVRASSILNASAALADLKHAVQQGIAAAGGTFFDRVMPQDVDVLLAKGPAENSIAVKGTITPHDEASVSTIRSRLKRHDALQRIVIGQVAKVDEVTTNGAVTLTDIHIFGALASSSTPATTMAAPRSWVHQKAHPRKPDHDSNHREGRTHKHGIVSGTGHVADHASLDGNEDHEREESVTASMTINNVDYGRLRKTPSVLAAFKEAIREALVSEAGGHTTPEFVEMALSAGSVRVHSTIAPLRGHDASTVKLELESSMHSLRELLVAKVTSLRGIADVSTGRVTISDLEISMQEHEEWTDVDLSLAVLLIGTVGGFMVIFYLVNWRDSDIKRHTWTITSTTISIFMSVLVFQCLCEFVEEFLSPIFAVRVVVWYVVVLGLFVAIQATTGIISGAMLENEFYHLGEEKWVIADTTHPAYGARIQDHQLRSHELNDRDHINKSVAYIEGCEVFVTKLTDEKDNRIVRMECYVSLLTYIAGFAAINAGATLQQHEYFRERVPMAILPIVCAQAFLGFLYVLFRLARGVQAQHGSDGKQDDREVLWEHECRQAELGISSLSASFLIVQVLRLQITGELPDKQGLEVTERQPDLYASSILYLSGLAAAAASILVGLLLGRTREETTLRSGLQQIQLIASMISAWCTIWAIRMVCERMPFLDHLGIGVGTMAWQLMLAVVASGLSCVLIFAVDTLEDMVGQESWRSLTQSIISALSLLVGFSWQRGFEHAVKCMTASFSRSNPMLMKMAISLVVVVLVLPAWRKYIVVKVYSYKKMWFDEMRALQAKSIDTDLIGRAINGGAAYEGMHAEDGQSNGEGPPASDSTWKSNSSGDALLARGAD